MIRDNYIVHPRIAEAMSHLIGPNVKAMQSMLFIKPSGKPGQAWHQDEHFIPTRDCSLTGLWIALDDANIENGCLWVRPGSHKDRVIYDTAPHGSHDFDEGNQLVGTPDDDDAGVPVEVKRGSAIVFNGYLHHRSLPNKADKGTFRRSLVNHYMSANSLLPWDWDGRIAPTRDMRDIMLVCGVDPYAWKGTEDITFAFLRAETVDDSDPNRDKQKRVF
jgi:ectoine hydroxylase-related dioxygenase (phytanoyl-CoA dioxygenase family)